MNAITYLKHKYAREYTLFRITPEGGFYVVDGREIPSKEFEAAYPLPLYVRTEKLNGAIGKNCDNTKNWLYED